MGGKGNRKIWLKGERSGRTRELMDMIRGRRQDEEINGNTEHSKALTSLGVVLYEKW